MSCDRFDIKDRYVDIDLLSDEALAKAICDLDYWNPDLNLELVRRADKIEPGLLKRYEEEEAFEPIVEKAAEILNVEIYR